MVAVPISPRCTLCGCVMHLGKDDNGQLRHVCPNSMCVSSRRAGLNGDTEIHGLAAVLLGAAQIGHLEQALSGDDQRTKTLLQL